MIITTLAGFCVLIMAAFGTFCSSYLITKKFIEIMDKKKV